MIMSLANIVYQPIADRQPPAVMVQKFLRAGGTLDGVKKAWGVDTKRGQLYSNLVGFKYNLLESPLSQIAPRQCRGLILDEDDNWEVVARPFDKFFNHGEGFAADIDWDTARVQEKLDGSLLIMYRYNGTWMFATTGTPDAFADVQGHPKSFTYSQFARSIFATKGMVFPDVKMWGDWTFLFELTSPYNRVVVRHPEPKMALIGMRSRLTGAELHASEFPCEKLNWPCVESFLLFSMEEILYTFRTMNPLKQEGYVVVDADFNRVKVKHPGYIALHHLRGDGFTPKRILEAVRNGETDEIIAAFEEWKEPFLQVQTALDKFTAVVAAEYEVLASMPYDSKADVKAFAEKALQTSLPSCIFAVKKAKAPSVKQFIRDMHIESLLVQLETFNEAFSQ